MIHKAGSLVFLFKTTQTTKVSVVFESVQSLFFIQDHDLKLWSPRIRLEPARIQLFNSSMREFIESIDAAGILKYKLNLLSFVASLFEDKLKKTPADTHFHI